MSLDLALVSFKGQSTAASVFGTLRDRVGSDTPWTNEVAIVEHHGNDRMSVRGTFGSRYAMSRRPITFLSREQPKGPSRVPWWA